MLTHKPTRGPASFRKQSRLLRLSVLGLALGFALQPVVSTANWPRGYWTYTVTDLGSILGAGRIAYAINNPGQIVGEFTDPQGNKHPFLYSGGQIRDLGGLPGWPDNSARAINDSGEIVGFSYGDTGGNSHAFLFSGGQMLDLGQVASLGSPLATIAINKWGAIAGTSLDSKAGLHGALWYRSTVFQVPNIDFACGINDVFQMAGFDMLVHSPDVFLYNPWTNQTQDIGALDPHNENIPWAINNSGQVVGYTGPLFDSVFYSSPSTDRAFLYSGGGSMRYLGTLGGPASFAWAINDSDEVVGTSSLSNGDFHAFTYSGNVMTDLNNLAADPSWVLQSANGINSSGQIVGFGVHNGVGPSAFLFTPTFHPYPVGLGR
jgi:probable HAF family extracellular repeat protein